MAQWPVMWPEERADVTNIDEERMKAEIDTLQQRMRDLQKQRNAILGALFTSWHQRNTPPSPEVRYVHVAVPQLVPARIVRGPPPPPPLPPPNFLKQKKPEPMRINKKPEKTNDILNSSVRKIDMSEVARRNASSSVSVSYDRSGKQCRIPVTAWKFEEDESIEKAADTQ
ncbi:hypothetical protein QR680_011295 [Steinernema hermaphroditum]|uniref:Uncharacterized protein n=1 Tax=Steinernema hermaphroditum TaxID=289476 RepID=A0AA39IRT4_9BILA|nr:hypothetical protein QR680_011295 [Steinernema hermaphroditum]